MPMYDQIEKPPVVKMGEAYSVLTAQGSEKFYECLYVEPLPKSIDLIEDIGSLAADSTSNANKITILEMEGAAARETDISEVFQMWMEVIDDITVTVKEPSAQGRFKTKNNQIRIDYNSGPVEIYVSEDDTMYVDVANLTNYTLPQTRIAFWGWRIVGRLLVKSPDKYTRIVATGFSR